MKALNFSVCLLLLGLNALAANGPAALEPDSLEAELQKLSTETNQAPAGVSAEKLYSVQYRYSPLKHRHEISLGGARNFNTDGYTSSLQIDLAYRFYLSDKWFVGLSGSYVFNEFNSSGKRLFEENNELPDAVFTKSRGDLSLGYNLFYGKFRVSMDRVFYFDQYLTLGPGLVSYGNGRAWGLVGDIGFVGWFGKHFSIRLGLKDFFVKEVRRKSSGMVHNLLGHTEVGYLF